MPIGYEYIVCHMEMISLIDLMGINNTNTLKKERKNGCRKITEKISRSMLRNHGWPRRDVRDVGVIFGLLLHQPKYAP